MKKIHHTIAQLQASAILRGLKYRDRKRQAPVYRDEHGKRIIPEKIVSPEFINKQDNAWNQTRDMAKHASIHQLARMFRYLYNSDRDMMVVFSYTPDPETAHLYHRKGALVRMPGKTVMDSVFFSNCKDAMAIAMLGTGWYDKVQMLRRENWESYDILVTDDSPDVDWSEISAKKAAIAAQE